MRLGTLQSLRSQHTKKKKKNINKHRLVGILTSGDESRGTQSATAAVASFFDSHRFGGLTRAFGIRAPLTPRTLGQARAPVSHPLGPLPDPLLVRISRKSHATCSQEQLLLSPFFSFHSISKTVHSFPFLQSSPLSFPSLFYSTFRCHRNLPRSQISHFPPTEARVAFSTHSVTRANPSFRCTRHHLSDRLAACHSKPPVHYLNDFQNSATVSRQLKRSSKRSGSPFDSSGETASRISFPRVRGTGIDIFG